MRVRLLSPILLYIKKCLPSHHWIPKQVTRKQLISFQFASFGRRQGTRYPLSMLRGSSTKIMTHLCKPLFSCEGRGLGDRRRWGNDYCFDRRYDGRRRRTAKVLARSIWPSTTSSLSPISISLHPVVKQKIAENWSRPLGRYGTTSWKTVCNPTI